MAEVQSCKSCTYTANEQKRWYQDRNFILGLLVFLATGLVAVFTGSQAWLASDTAKRQLRAYVASNPNFTSFFINPSSVEIQYELFNHGQTPAYDVSHSSIVEILPYPLPDNYPLPAIPPLPESTLTLHPTAPFIGITKSRTFSRIELDEAIHNNGVNLYILGLVAYIDAYGHRRQTKFCRFVVGTPELAAIAATGIGLTQPGSVRYGLRKQHNSAT